MIRAHLLDLNVLIALVDSGHQHHQKAQEWFTSSGQKLWGLCPLTEAGFLRVTTNPAYAPQPQTFEAAIAILLALQAHPGYRYWGISKSWVELTAAFSARISGHRQVTDAYLLGMAIDQNGILVTFDKGIRAMAGSGFGGNIFVLE